MLKDIPIFKRGQFAKVYEKLSKKNKSILDDYKKECLEGCSQDKALDMQRNILKLHLTLQKDFIDINLEQAKIFMQILKDSKLSDSAKNDINAHVLRLLRMIHKDWSERFDNFKSPLFKQIRNPQNKRKIDEDTVLTKDEIKKLLTTENKTFWKAFLMTQYEGALRTKEVRELTWEAIGKEDGDYYSFNLFATKTQKDKPIVLSEAKKWIDKLRQEQINTNQKGKYIFHSMKDINKPIPKFNVSIWMRQLSKKALGREIWCYVLRHTRGTEYKKLIKEKKLSKDNALETMGHSEKMFDKIYSHVDKEAIREMIKEQVYNFEDLPEEKKHELKKEIDELKIQLKSQEEDLEKHMKSQEELLESEKVLSDEQMEVLYARVRKSMKGYLDKRFFANKPTGTK